MKNRFFLILSLMMLVSDLYAQETSETQVGLRHVYQMALKNSERIASAQEGYFQSVFLKRQAFAALLPDVSLEGSYFRQERISGEGLAGQSFLIPQRKSYFARIEQTIFSGFRERNGLRQANFLIEANEENLRQEKNTLLIDVAQAFYDSLALQREKETLEDSLRLQRERLREIEARSKVGLARRTEVLLIESQLANDESRLLRVTNALQTARERLNFAAGTTIEGVLTDDVREVVPVADADFLLKTALARRADLKAAEWQVQAAKANTNVIRGEYWPQFDLASNIYGHREGIQSPVTWDIEFSVSFPLFYGRETRARELQAASRARQAELNQQQLERQILLDIKTSLNEWQSSDSLISSLQKQLSVAEENYRLIQEEYRIGLSNNLEVLTAYNFLQSARLDLEKERINRKFVWIQLQNALGENPVADTQRREE